jgi:hypothetical protein
MGDRSVRQCKERWTNYLSQASDGPLWTIGEDVQLERMVGERGHKWKSLEVHFPGRTDLQLKNRYNVIVRRHQRLFRLASSRPRVVRSIPIHEKENPRDGGSEGLEVEVEVELEVDLGSECVEDEWGEAVSWSEWSFGCF